MNVAEISPEQIDNEIEDRRKEVAIESEKNIDELIDEARKHGINLQKPRQN